MIAFFFGLQAELVPAPARADATVTPSLTPLGRHYEAMEELHALLAMLPNESREKVRGIYVAFARSPSDVRAQAACDDDGDPVIVLSDALLLLMEHVSHAQTLDLFASPSTDNLAALATHYASDQRRGERLLPPVAGAFDVADTRATEIVHTARFREALAGTLGHELSIFLRGDLACPNPTATHERGDDVWTDEEDAAAQSAAPALYGPARTEQRDSDAVTLAWATNADVTGYLGWISFFAQLEDHGPRAIFSYAMLRPNARARLASTERFAARARTFTR